MSGGNIKVVVRCRPLNRRELEAGKTCLIQMTGNQTIISRAADLQSGKETEDTKSFTFDKSYWSANKDDPSYADQKTVYSDLGVDLLNHAFDGYNCCIFAYGQTGSGKSYSMMGYGEDKGIIPLTCSELFNRIKNNVDTNLTYRVEVSYIEIYNEKVRDLLNPKNKGNLKVREHPSLGPYVEDLSRLAVTSFDDINHLMDEGNKARTVAATNMNETSSRSHAVFTVFLTQTRLDDLTKLETEKVARISLVDLAGSERANSTGATGARLKEGANINRSLTTLGKVIAGLAEQSTLENKKSKKSKETFIPYRDSVLTWLLKDSLGGNSKTAMIAAISPADYEETLSTLRYADQAKKIKNKAVINEDPNAKLIRELKEELDTLRERLAEYAPNVVEQLSATSAYRTGSRSSVMITDPPALHNDMQKVEIVDKQGNKKVMTRKEIVDQLQSSEKLLANLNETWEEKLKRTEKIHLERERALEELGILVHKNNVGVYAPKTPHLLNLNEDPLMSECLMYQIKPGVTRVGRQESEVPSDIRLSGPEIQDEHCTIENVDGVVTLSPINGSRTLVNGRSISEPRELHSGYRIILGDYHRFRFNNPEEVLRERDHQKARTVRSLSTGYTDDERPDSPNDLSAFGRCQWDVAVEEYIKNSEDGELEKLRNHIDVIRRTRSESRNELYDDDSPKDSVRNSMATSIFGDSQESVYTDMTVISHDVEEKIKAEKERLQKQLDDQRQFYEAKIHRMSLQYPPGIYTPIQMNLLRKSINRWKKHCDVSMAEVVLTQASILKEANVIAKELNKDVAYQFCILHEGQFSKPISYWETSCGLLNTEEDTDVLVSKPGVGIRVTDRRHQSVYVWSLTKFQDRLRKMQDLYKFIDRPEYRKHLNCDDLFYESPCPKYSCIGSASMSVKNLEYQLPYESCIDIMCRSTGQVKGTLRVLVTPMMRQLPAGSTNQDNQHVQVGQQLVFQIQLLELQGLNEAEFKDVHVQFRLSSFGGIPSHSTAEQIFATEPVNEFGNGPISLDYSQTLAMVVTESTLNVIRNQMIAFEIYGQAQPEALDRYERWDDQREKPCLSDLLMRQQQDATDSSSLSERRPEEEMLATERHDVLAWIQICELMPNGDYLPVQVVSSSTLDRGVLSLRQGLQRRIQITLSHTSGRQFAWKRIVKASIGRVRLLDNKERIIESPAHEDIPLKITQHQKVTYNHDGTSTLNAQGAWDSSQHDCLFLNRLTQSSCRILLNLKWEVEVDRCSRPIPFSMDIAVKIQSRDSSGTSRLRKLLGTSKHMQKCSAVFLIHLRPPMTRRVSQLWRLNTAAKYVRGEETLGAWRPRGVSIVSDDRHIQRRIRCKDHVTSTALVLALKGNAPSASSSPQNHASVQVESKSMALANKVLKLWMSKFGTDEEMVISQEPPVTGMLQHVTCRSDSWHADVKLITLTDNVSKKGYLMYQENAVDDCWVKRWFVLKRPYIHIYTNPSESDERGIINVSSVRVDYNRALEQMIHRNHVFALYTTNNAYTLQASQRTDMVDWITKIDPMFPINKLKTIDI